MFLFKLTFDIAQMLGAIVILSVAGSLYQNIALDRIRDILPDASREDILQLTSGRYSDIFTSLSEGNRMLVVQEVTLAIRNGFLILVVGSALALVSSLFMSVSIWQPMSGSSLPQSILLTL